MKIRDDLELMLLNCDTDQLSEFSESVDIIDNIISIIEGTVERDKICCQVAIQQMKNLLMEGEVEFDDESFVSEY